MMVVFFRLCVFVFLVIASNQALAGMKGYKVVFLDLTPDQQFKVLFSKYRSSFDASSVSACWEARKGDWIDMAYIKTQPIDISREKKDLIALGNAIAVRDFAKSMAAYRDDQVLAGFDGAYVVTAEKDGFSVRGISKGAGISKYFPVRPKSLKSLDLALCSAASVFDADFSL
jgi:hypothetical protein